ncbi:MAG: formyl-CoA transferase [Papillibacter sp.]|nr:formyl-CoA transferase [Papillibacter sp.]
MSGTGPLTGYKVLDLTQFESGTVCTETLAWMGAEVWKVERPHTGELGRYSIAEPGVDTYGFIIMNMNKKSITCNMKTSKGLELMKKLVKQADVLIENMGPGSIERLGLAYDVCKELNPRLIYAQIKGFGTDGPFADYPAFAPIGQAVGGVPAMTGFPDSQPCQPGVNVGDSGTGYLCAMGIIAALLQREHTGKGQRIEVTLQDACVAFGRANWEPYYNNGRVAPKRVGNGLPMEDVAPAGMYPCKPFGPNDYVHIYCSRHPGSNQFANLCRIIGREDLLSDPRMATPRSRYLVKDELDAIISQWTGQHTKQEAMDILCREDIPAGAVLDIDDITHDEYLVKRGVMTDVEHRQRGRLRVPGLAVRMDGNTVAYETSPELGEHNAEVYGGLLGLTEAELEQLRHEKVI